MDIGDYQHMTQPKVHRPVSQDRLIQKMSEVISLREQVAQAELVANALRLPVVGQRNEPDGSLASSS